MAILTESSRLQVRVALSSVPVVWRLALAVRDVALRGPWTTMLVRFYQWRAQTRTPMPVYSPTIFPSLVVSDAVASLQSRGIALGLEVPKAEVDELLAHFATLTDEELDEYREVHLKCPAADRIARDERLVAIAREYLGAEPILFRTVGWVRHAFKGESWFHFDSADIKDLVFFVYLNDVDHTCHPHAVIPGTRRKSWRQLLDRKLPDADAKRQYDDSIEVIVGPKGTAFLEDTTIYHKRMGGTSTRLSLAVTYTLQRRP